MGGLNHPSLLLRSVQCYSRGKSFSFPSLIFSFNPLAVSCAFSFYFYEIESWDGNGAGCVDSFLVHISGLEDTTIDTEHYHAASSEENATGLQDDVHWSKVSDSISNSSQRF